MAESSNLFETLKCIICLDFAEDAVETSCCHQVCCNDCSQPLEKCPTCEKTDFQLQPNIAIRRMIANFPANCPYEKCGTKTTKGELRAHLETCPVKNLIPCLEKECDFADKAEVVANHVVDQHPSKAAEYLIQNLIKEKHKTDVKCFFPSCNVRGPKEQIWNHVQEIHREDLKVFNDVSSLCIVGINEPVKMKNSLGNPVKIGNNGKFYCGREDAVKEGKHCSHPNDNCCACMKLDLMFRDLAPYQLVNKEGIICKPESCNHSVPGGFFSVKSKRAILDRLCRKTSCGNNPAFYCERSRVQIRQQYERGLCSCGRAYNYLKYTQTTYYCRRHGEESEQCSACKDITDLMADPHLVYNAVWDI